MCSSLPCRVSGDTNACSFVNGKGAAIGTTCDSGKVKKFNFNS